MVIWFVSIIMNSENPIRVGKITAVDKISVDFMISLSLRGPFSLPGIFDSEWKR